MRDGNLIKTFSTPEPGSELTFVDEVPECSRYTYSAIAVNASGESPAVETKAFVGTLEPSDPTGITLVETSTPGEVTITWTPVTTDIRGNNLDPEFVTYRIYSEGSQSNLLFSNISGTSKTFKALDDTSVQTFVQYSIVAETKGGISNYVYSPLLPIGPAYSTPYHESFAEGKDPTSSVFTPKTMLYGVLIQPKTRRLNRKMETTDFWVRRALTQKIPELSTPEK